MAAEPEEQLLRLHPDDPVGVARRELTAGEQASGVAVRDQVPAGHKVALVDLPAGTVVRKYGQPIGVTTAPVHAGEHVHSHNLASLAGVEGGEAQAEGRLAGASNGGSRSAGAAASGLHIPEDRRDATFAGFVRPDGRVGTRNYLAVLSSVNCSATAAKMIAGAFSVPGALDPYPGVDGVLALTHSTGCGLGAQGEGLAVLRRTLAGYARHPNVVGVVVVGLGCEVNQVDELVDEIDLPERTSLNALTIQEAGGTRAAVQQGVAAVRAALESLEVPERTPVPASELVLGLNCGASDAWSGISANPVLGAACDLLVACGGTAVLGETPEIHGAEHILAARAVSPAVAERLRERVAWWERYTAADGTNLDSNPSPGNRAGGITTIEEKSLGAVAKGGGSPLADVVGYAEPVRSRGLVFMDTPGYDPVSVTGIVAGGATVVCFTTGRGSVFGGKPAPTLKLATTTDLYKRMAGDMDMNAGAVLDGDATVPELGAELFDRLLAVASGELTCSEELGFGDEEFTPWQLGAVL